jgi:hypothetical protein
VLALPRIDEFPYPIHFTGIPGFQEAKQITIAKGRSHAYSR